MNEKVRTCISSGTIIVLFLFSAAISIPNSCNKSPNDEKYRVVILTDMTHDDGNSLIRFLHYSPCFDLEALIVTNQLPDFIYNDTIGYLPQDNH